MGFNITYLDKLFLNFLSELGALTNEHMRRICYASSPYGDKSARRRTKLFEKQGLIDSIARFGVGGRQKVFTISKKNRRRVADILGKESVKAFKFKKGFNVEHQLITNSVLIAFLQACRINKNYCCEYITDLDGLSGQDGVQKQLLTKEYLPCRGEIAFIPDAVISLTNKTSNKKALSFLEVDRGSTTLKKIGGNDKNVQSKISGYVSLWETENYKRFGEYFDYDFTGFRLLWVTESQKRLESVLGLCVTEETGDLVWLTTVDAINEKGALGDIWVTPERDGIQKFVKDK